MLRFDDESRGGSGGLPDARCGGAAAQHPRLAGAATGGAGARRGRRPGFLAAEMAGEVGPTAWSRGSTSAIGCWRSRKGRDAAVDLRAGSAGSIPYPDASFDVAVSTQVLEVMCSHSLGMRSRNANRLSGS